MKTVLTVALYLSVFALFSPSDAYATNLNAVIEMADSGDIKGAIKKLDDILKRDEGNIQVRFFKATLLMDAGRVKEAQRVLEEVARRYPNLPEAYNNLAALHASQGRLIEAKTILENLTISHPDFAIAHENLSDIYAALASQGMERAARLGSRSETSRRKLELLEELVEFVPLEADDKGASAKPESRKVKVKSVAPPQQTTKAKPVLGTKPAKKKLVAAVEAKKEKKAIAPAKEPAKPSQKSEPTTRQKVVSFVNNWLNAWASKDIEKYQEYYASDFEYKGTTKAEWMKKKRARFKKAGAIDVKISNIEVAFDKNKAIIKFTQKYKSKTISDVGKKRLELVMTYSGWKIVSEIWSSK